MPTKIVLYGHAACPAVPPTRAILSGAHVDYEYVNIQADENAAARVRMLNAGNESVPTLVFPDGTHLTEPSFWELRGKLRSLGYRVGWWGWLVGNIWSILIVVGGLLAIARAIGLI